jgi:hypothetical protein
MFNCELMNVMEPSAAGDFLKVFGESSASNA